MIFKNGLVNIPGLINIPIDKRGVTYIPNQFGQIFKSDTSTSTSPLTFLLTGQSNAVGVATKDSSQYDVYDYNGTKGWNQTTEEWVDFDVANVNGWKEPLENTDKDCIAIGWVGKMKQLFPNREIRIIHIAQSFLSITEWEKPIGSKWEVIADQLPKALEGNRLDGVLWRQGPDDDGETQEWYLERLNELISNLRNDFSENNMLFLSCELPGTRNSNNYLWTMNTDGDVKTSTIEGLTVTQGDRVHYDSYGNAKMGEELAKRTKEHLDNTWVESDGRYRPLFDVGQPVNNWEFDRSLVDLENKSEWLTYNKLNFNREGRKGRHSIYDSSLFEPSGSNWGNWNIKHR